MDGNTDFEELKKLLIDDSWPKAIPDKLICDIDSEEDKKLRAMEIIRSVIAEPLENKKFLDFGCGQGHIIQNIEKPALAIGYDINISGSLVWESQNESKLLTTSWEHVVASAPYDVVLIYDVLDHIVDKNPADVLKMIRSIVTKNTRIYVRCHPWCGAHGGHLYREINKAYVHLVFSQEELRSLGYNPTEVVKVIRPQVTYSKWAEKAGFSKNINFSTITDAPSGFFKQNPILRQRIKKTLEIDKWPSVQMRQSFVDFTLQAI